MATKRPTQDTFRLTSIWFRRGRVVLANGGFGIVLSKSLDPLAVRVDSLAGFVWYSRTAAPFGWWRSETTQRDLDRLLPLNPPYFEDLASFEVWFDDVSQLPESWREQIRMRSRPGGRMNWPFMSKFIPPQPGLIGLAVWVAGDPINVRDAALAAGIPLPGFATWRDS